MIKQEEFRDSDDCRLLKGLLNIFHDLTKYLYGKAQSLDQIEKEFEPIEQGYEDFSRKHLAIIKDKKNINWIFWGSFPPFTDEQILDIAKALKERKDLKNCIIDLYKIMKNIELVSIVLRFVDPYNFGMFTPPVEKLLETKRGYNYVETYINYLNDLKKIQIKCGETFNRIADVDMAIWVLSNLERKERSGVFEKNMGKWAPNHYYKIKDFLLRPNSLIKKIKVINLPEEIWEEDELDKAKMLSEKDLFVAGLIAGNIIKKRIPEVCRKLGIETTYKKNGRPCCCKIGNMLFKLSDRGEISDIERIMIKEAWNIRNEICKDPQKATIGAVATLIKTAGFILNKFKNLFN